MGYKGLAAVKALWLSTHSAGEAIICIRWQCKTGCPLPVLCVTGSPSLYNQDTDMFSLFGVGCHFLKLCLPNMAYDWLLLFQCYQ